MVRKLSTSVRLSPDLKKQVEKAAKKKGVTISEYITYALERQSEYTLAGIGMDFRDMIAWKTLSIVATMQASVIHNAKRQPGLYETYEQFAEQTLDAFIKQHDD